MAAAGTIMAGAPVPAEGRNGSIVRREGQAARRSGAPGHLPRGAAGRALLEHLRAGFAEYDAGRIDAFELDAIVHRYTRAARELWTFCAVSGAQVETAVRTLAYWQERGELPDWWRALEPRDERPEGRPSDGES